MISFFLFNENNVFEFYSNYGLELQCFCGEKGFANI